MRATFIELPPFERLRDEYYDDESFKELQSEMMKDPVAGAVIQGAGRLGKSGLATSAVARESAAACE